MPLWVQIVGLLLLALVVVQLFGIEGNIHLISESIDQLTATLGSTKNKTLADYLQRPK
jgi:hypothetical protein